VGKFFHFIFQFKMTLPLEVQQLCNHYLELLRQGHQASLDFEQREALYQAFGLLQWWRGSRTNDEPLWLSEASRAVSWLSVVTARKVIFVWETANNTSVESLEEFVRTPRGALEAAEKFLAGKISENEAWSACRVDFFPYELTTLKVYCAFKASLAALETTLLGRAESFANLEDFADYSLVAFAGIDSNGPGVWIDDFYVNLAGWEIARDEKWTAERIERIKQYQPVKNDPQKELEFWEWWLTEAVPQAWELATKS
jgi:hypothetical protein